VLEYGDWIGEDWHRRMMAVDRAIRNAIELDEAIHLAADLRRALSDASRNAAFQASQAQPAFVITLRPVYLVFTGEDQRPGVAFERPAHLSFGPWTFMEVHPSEVADYAARHFQREDSSSSRFRLYLRGERFLFHEAWLAESGVVEHWGICGDAGEVREHMISHTAERARLLVKLRNAAENRGYRPIPTSQQRTIVARRAIVDAGSDADLDLRYELQDALDEELARGCLGHCDGGAAGGGSMDVFCFVVDIERGMATIERTLGEQKFRGFSASLLR
jgi:hypothetical protein